MEILINESVKTDAFNVLLIGNNPIELNTIYEQLNKLKDKKFIAEIAFDLKSALKSRLKFKPSFILIDDNVGIIQLRKMIKTFSSHKETQNIPITVIKNENSGKSAEGVQEFILKSNTNGESLANTLFNSIRVKKAQGLIYNTYYSSKKKLGLVS